MSESEITTKNPPTPEVGSAPTNSSTPDPGNDPLEKIPVSVILKWLKDYNFIVVGLFAAIIFAVGAFFATKASLGGQIEALQTRLARNEALRDELGVRSLYLQRSNLRLLEDEIKRIEGFKMNWKKPDFKFSKIKGNPSEMAEPPNDEPILSFDIGLYGNLATSPETRAIPDTELTATLVQILNVLTEYNQGFQNSGLGFMRQPVPTSGGMRLPLQFPLTRDQADRFTENSARCISQLDGLLKSGVANRLSESQLHLTQVLATYEKAETSNKPKNSTK